MVGHVAVIGLDGADWRLLDPWIQAGELPTIAELVARGSRGKLRSTVRPESSVAWSSFSTGVNPGKHGVFGFVEPRAEPGYAFRLATGSSVRSRRFWDVLGEQGYQVGLLNIPFTYPPSAVNGWMVTGMLTPGIDVGFTHPPELRQSLLDRFRVFALDADEPTGEKDELIAKVQSYTAQQRDVACFLLENWAWDFFAMVFTGPDRLQHFLWADMDDSHPFHERSNSGFFPEAVLDLYRTLDDALARVLDRLPDDTLVLLMSDHGFNGCARRFRVNLWLQEEGLLTLNPFAGASSGLASLASKLGSVDWLRRLKRAVAPGPWGSTALESRAFATSINWAETTVYFGPDGGLHVNLDGREPQGTVSPDSYGAFRRDLRQRLLAARDPQTGRSPLAHVYLREELYHGPFLDRAPDLILEPVRDEEDPSANFVLDGSLDRRGAGVFGSSLPYSANHTLDGILVAYGSGAARGRRVQNARIVDLAPTVLAVLDVGVPDQMDGRVLDDLFVNGTVPAVRRTTSEENWQKDAADALSPDDEAAVQDRLRNLGYLE